MIPTGAGEARNTIIVNSGDAVIVIGGSWGTLSELALAMRHGRAPVVQLGGWRLLDQNGDPVPGRRTARHLTRAGGATHGPVALRPVRSRVLVLAR
ncbi:hypothetical protein ACFHYQ_15875 [Sphaerimonospora cavernae]|uniref:LSDAT prokaryote domain-containing protein n=1 Tax=Sphaerimonospora cavernae TaxID=1740611 RepID=A0ABV6U737_9ACTN